jgi:N utilization substance protein A
VGACVGIRGVRIQAIVRELHDEKIDVIEWNSDPSQFIAKALSPARVTGVYLEEMTGGSKTATVVVPEDQLSLAIGRDGQNARLAAKLTAWRIDIKSLPEAAADALNKAQSDPTFAEQNPDWVEALPQVETALAKKAEGRPLTPEEFTLLGRFVDRIERGAQSLREAALDAEREKRAAVEATLPSTAFDIPLDELGLSPSLAIKLSGEGYSTIGDLMTQLKLDSDVILALEGVGPETLKTIQSATADFKFPAPAPKAPVVEAQPEPEAEPEAPVAIAEPVAEAAAPAADEPVQLSQEDEELLAAMQGGQRPAVPGESIDEIFAKTSAKLVRKKPVRPGAAPASPADASKKKKKKKKFRELDYDPDTDTDVRRMRDEWEAEE